ncbi:MAG: gamma-glutamyl-gamma-aminobutyrate hydrolase family protein [Ilumatobacteraceae bacterium]
MRPLIALSSRVTERADTWRVPATALGRTYQDAIVRAGGQPVVLPPIDTTLDDLTETLARFDGVCLPGGPDVDPHRYGATEIDPRVSMVQPAHDALDLAMAMAAVELGLPLLAICRGHQVLNVALGGTLVQHIDEHRFIHHGVRLTPGSLAATAIGQEAPVGHSVHHQAIERLGRGLVVSGWAEDGTIEAVELPGRWVLGVQWHPEDTAEHDGDQQRLFDAFVTACRHGVPAF